MVRTLAIGVGNTHLNWGIFEGDNLVRRGRLAVSPNGLTCPEAWSEVDRLAAASVNAPALAHLESALDASLPDIRVIGRDVPCPVDISVPRPEEVGIDRLLTSLAWLRRGGGPAVIVDFGTAITIDVVSPEGGFRGGLILPGPELLARSLAEGTDRLPEVEVVPRLEPYGRDTVSAIGAGIFGLICGGVEHHLARLGRHLGPGVARVATGGGAPRYASWIPSLDRVTPDLLLDGIRVSCEDAPA